MTLEEKILEDIKKSGFPAEIEITAHLDKEWMVYSGPLFFDAEHEKEREIDIHAVLVDYSFSKEFPKLGIGKECKAISHLVIEVKKSENKPIVFFRDGDNQAHRLPTATFKSNHPRFHELALKSLGIYGVSGYLYDEGEDLEALGLKHRYMDIPLHRTFYTAFAGTQPSAVYEAVKQSSKALEFIKTRYGTGGKEGKVLHIFVPVIVIDGEIWSASLNSDGKMSIIQKEHLLLRQNQLIEYAPGNQQEEERIYDVVTRAGFPAFLKELEADHLSLYRAWTNYHHAQTKIEQATKVKKTKKKKSNKSSRR
jgi:hypothetical protein